MELILRNECVLTGAKDLELLLKLESFPISMYTVDQNEDHTDLKTDMQWWISRSTGGIQLNPLVPLEILYNKGHGSGAVGNIWQQHHAEFADFISRCEVTKVLEIGAGHGALARLFVDMHPSAHYYILEPNLPDWSHERVTMYSGMFDGTFVMPFPIEAVVHSHTFEHMYEPRKFLEHIAEFLSEGQWHIFSLPRLEVWLACGYSNALNFEHTLYLTEGNVDYLLHTSGLEVVHKTYFRQDHSIFYATRKCSSLKMKAIVPSDFLLNRTVFLSWVESTKKFVANTNQKVAQHAGSGKIFVFGGHIFTQFLIGFGLETAGIHGILDNDSTKVGRRLYGTTLLIFCPVSELKESAGAAVILRAGPYNEEIKQGIRASIKADVDFWE